MFTLGSAARETSLSKSAISRAIKSGRLSATRDDKGQYQIDPAELFRVYPQDGNATGNGERDATEEHTDKQHMELSLLRELLAEVRGERDSLRADRDHWREQAERMTLLLTHQPQAPAEAGNARPSFWRRLTGRG